MFRRLSIFAVLSIVMGMALANPLPDPASEAVSRRQTGEHHGTATFFFQGGAAGACGTVHQDSDKIVALQTTEYACGIHCGKTISITDSNSGKVAAGVIADECPGCGAKNNIDLSVGLFTGFEAESVGVFPVVWEFV